MLRVVYGALLGVDDDAGLLSIGGFCPVEFRYTEFQLAQPARPNRLLKYWFAHQ